MKKKFLLLISLMLAFVLSLSLIACGGGSPSGGGKPNGGKPNGGDGDGEGEGGGGTKIEYTTDKAVQSINAFLGANAVSGTVTLDLDELGAPITMPFDRRGDMVKISLPTISGLEALSGMPFVFDLNTGNAYMQATVPGGDTNSFYLMQVLPQGYVDYIVTASGLTEVKPTVTAEMLETYFEYDKTKNAVTASIDIAPAVNGALLPIQSVYEDGGSIVDAVNAYLALLPAESGEALELADIFDGAEALVEMLEESGLTIDGAVTAVDAMLEQSGAEASIKALIAAQGGDEIYAAVKDRKIIEVIQGALDLVAEMLPQDAADGQDANGEESGGMEMYAEMLFYYLFEKDVDTADTVEQFATMKDVLYALLNNTELKTIIDSLPDDDDATASLKTLVSKSVEFKTLAADVAIGFNADCVLNAFSVEFEAEYTADGTATMPLLPKRKSSASVALKSVEYAASKPEFELKYIADVSGSTLPKTVAAVICGDAEGKASVFYDSCGTNITVGTITPAYYVVYVNDGQTETVRKQPFDTDGAVTFDAKTSSFVFDKKIFTDACAEHESDLVTVNVDARIGTGTASYDVTITVHYCADYDVEKIGDIPLPIIEMLENIQAVM